MLDRFDDYEEVVEVQPRVLTPMEYDLEAYEVCYQQTMELIDYQTTLESLDDAEYTQEIHLRGESLGIEMESFAAKAKTAAMKAAKAVKTAIIKLFKIARKVLVAVVEVLDRGLGMIEDKLNNLIIGNIRKGSRLKLDPKMWELLGRPNGAMDLAFKMGEIENYFDSIRGETIIKLMDERLSTIKTLSKELDDITYVGKGTELAVGNEYRPMSIDLQMTEIDTAQRTALWTLAGGEANREYLKALAESTTLDYSMGRNGPIVTEYKYLRSQAPLKITIDAPLVPNTTLEQFKLKWEVGKPNPIKKVDWFVLTTEAAQRIGKMGLSHTAAMAKQSLMLRRAKKLLSGLEAMALELGDRPAHTLQGHLRNVIIEQSRGLMLAMQHDRYVHLNASNALDMFVKAVAS